MRPCATGLHAFWTVKDGAHACHRRQTKWGLKTTTSAFGKQGSIGDIFLRCYVELTALAVPGCTVAGCESQNFAEYDP